MSLLGLVWAGTPTTDDLMKMGISKKVAKLAIQGHKKAKVEAKKSIYTIIDYTITSNKKRMWVIDMKTGKKLFVTHVAHGKVLMPIMMVRWIKHQIKRAPMRPVLGCLLQQKPMSENMGILCD